MKSLNAATLEALEGVARPQYNRGDVGIGIVHFGVGGFHRAHQAMYLDALMNEGKALEWGICGVGVMPSDQRMKQVMDAQNGLYTLVLKHADGQYEPRVIGSIVDYLYAPEDPEAVIEQMAAESTKIVSLTVTEGGYNFHHVTGEFNFEHPDVKHDLEEGAAPKTTFGLVTEALRRRLERGMAPFTIMSCDNIQGNGDVARKMFSAYAERKSPEVGRWMHETIHFPNSMVDRITPVTTDDDRREVAERFGIDDGWPVVCEPFTQWVLEDHFNLGRPPYEEVGVQVVDDVMPYELMKLRLLNASHQALTYFGYLAGYRYAHEVCQDELFANFLLDYMNEEATPTLSPVPGVDLDEYKHTLIERFANPEIRDTLARLCAESSDRIPKWLLPVIREQLERDGEIKRSAAVVASWARYAEGVDEQGEPIEIVDRLKDELHAIAQHNRDNPLAFIENRELFGDLVDDPRFVEAYTDALSRLHRQGARATVEALRQAD
ncbi:mannitol dehydrogenase family protein [Kushneria phosphatilytica]|uniref:Mannitol dehydrogenase family protein n=1 Tax=Kushneria phosphatilytica TaxID=657387 RepID=A0A1S1NLT5_9GAMM|nr:mannitol dehydrogenase family protein [Kushneria phosphatilytica]OHV07701.1 mannitol dehydrogenase [Kushneria phosphatilytica]QEL10197.1 mannitol dehydrogenase family protein [Kushneria phosphatilytica]